MHKMRFSEHWKGFSTDVSDICQGPLKYLNTINICPKLLFPTTL